MNETRPKAPRRGLLVVLVMGVVLFVTAAGVLVGASREQRDLSAVGQPGNPFVLLLSPAHAADRASLDGMAAFLTKESGMTVELQVANSRDQAVALAGANAADAFLLPLFDYLFCRQEYLAEAGLQVLREGDAHAYHGEILARADSDIASLAGLAGRRVGYVDAHSTSGFLYPAATLRQKGVDAAGVLLGTPEAALEALRAGRVDAAAVHAHAAEGADDLRVLASTPEIPNEPVFFRDGTTQEQRQRLSDALVRFAASPEGPATLGKMAGITGFVPRLDAAYFHVEETVRAADKSLQDLVPRGWWIHNANRGLDPAL